LPKFDASSIEECEYDFTGIRSVHTGEFIQDKGVVPEPSRQLVSDTMKLISASIKDVTGKEVDPTPGAVTELLETIEDDDVFERMSEGMFTALVDFCRGHPTRESLDALPWNRFMAFFGYLMENMLSPEASTPAVKQPLRTLKSV
jgi:hypothetical protein